MAARRISDPFRIRRRQLAWVLCRRAAWHSGFPQACWASYSRVRPEPLAADRTRSLPGLWHGDASWSPCGGTDRRRSDQNAWVSFGKHGKFSRAPKLDGSGPFWRMPSSKRERLRSERPSSHGAPSAPKWPLFQLAPSILNCTAVRRNPHLYIQTKFDRRRPFEE
jgi:hypothetical protein